MTIWTYLVPLVVGFALAAWKWDAIRDFLVMKWKAFKGVFGH